LVWLGFRRDYPISEALTSFFFTFFKVFLNGCSGLFVTTLPRLLKIERADKFFFHFFSNALSTTHGCESARIKKAEDDLQEIHGFHRCHGWGQIQVISDW